MTHYSYLDIVEMAGCGLNTVKRIVKDNYPHLLKGRGITVEIPEDIAREIIHAIPKRNMVSEKAQMGLLGSTNDTTRIERLESMVEKLCGAVAAMVANQRPPAMIEHQQDYYSITAYCNVKHIKITFSEAIKFGKEAARMAAEAGLEVRQIPDERWGKVNSYPTSVLEKVMKP